MGSFFRRKNVKEKVDDTIFLRNGATLLEKLITSGNGKRNPIRSFSAEELKLATDNYDAQQLLTDVFDYKLYKGLLQNRPISVMKFGEGDVDEHEYLEPRNVGCVRTAILLQYLHNCTSGIYLRQP